MIRKRVLQISNFASRFGRGRTQPLSGSSNLIRFSELQSSALWVGYSANKLLTNGGFSSTIADPNGTFTMNKFTTTGANAGVYQVFSNTGASDFKAGETFTVSAWLATETGTTTAGFAYYDGGFFASDPFTITTTPTRYSRTFSLRTTPAPTFDSNVTVNCGVAAQVLLWWGYQLERGSTMTQYTKKS